MHTIFIRNYKGLQAYSANEILRIQGMSNYCKIFFVDNRTPLTVAKVLHWFEDNLPSDVFWRVHKTHLINANCIQQLHTAQKSFLLMQNGETVSISRRRVILFKNRA